MNPSAQIIISSEQAKEIKALLDDAKGHLEFYIKTDAIRKFFESKLIDPITVSIIDGLVERERDHRRLYPENWVVRSDSAMAQLGEIDQVLQTLGFKNPDTGWCDVVAGE